MLLHVYMYSVHGFMWSVASPFGAMFSKTQHNNQCYVGKPAHNGAPDGKFGYTAGFL